jgi:hypothetical protein
MADLSKLKRRSTLGMPPPPDEASTNLTAPEVAPAAPPKPAPTALTELSLSSATQPSATERKIGRRRVDGRSLRRTGRTLQFATRITEEFDELLHKIAQRDGLKLVEVLENSVAAYEASRKKQDRS